MTAVSRDSGLSHFSLVYRTPNAAIQEIPKRISRGSGCSSCFGTLAARSRPTRGRSAAVEAPCRQDFERWMHRITHNRFITLAVVFESSLVVVACAVGWLFHIHVWTEPATERGRRGRRYGRSDSSICAVAEHRTVPDPGARTDQKRAAGNAGTARSWPVVGMRSCVLAAVAGIGEEFLFRGARATAVRALDRRQRATDWLSD